ncbi:transposase, partial [Streptomonospora sediminis]
YGPVASDPTVSRTLTTLAAEPEAALAAIRTARAHARETAWTRAAHHAPPDADGRLIIDIDATLLTAHSDKENAAPTWKKGYGFHPLAAFCDHGPAGTGEGLTALLRPGNAGSNTATDHIAVAARALKQLPRTHRRGRKTLIRTDTAGGTHAFLDWLTRRGRWLSYSVGMTITDDIHTAITRIPATAWSPA